MVPAQSRNTTRGHRRGETGRGEAGMDDGFSSAGRRPVGTERAQLGRPDGLGVEWLFLQLAACPWNRCQGGASLARCSGILSARR